MSKKLIYCSIVKFESKEQRDTFSNEIFEKRFSEKQEDMKGVSGEMKVCSTEEELDKLQNIRTEY